MQKHILQQKAYNTPRHFEVLARKHPKRVEPYLIGATGRRSQKKIGMTRGVTKAFTLIEVLVALAILAIAVTALIAASQQTTNYVQYLKDKTVAHWIGMNVLAEARLGMQTFPTYPAWKEATTEALTQTWQWAATAETTSLPQTMRLRVRVRNNRYVELVEVIGFMRIPEA